MIVSISKREARLYAFIHTDRNRDSKFENLERERRERKYLGNREEKDGRRPRRRRRTEGRSV